MFKTAFESQHRRRKKARNALEQALAGDLDEDGGGSYSEKLGRWKVESLSTLADIQWWATLQIVNRVRQPLERLGNSMKKNTPRSLPW